MKAGSLIFTLALVALATAIPLAQAFEDILQRNVNVKVEEMIEETIEDALDVNVFVHENGQGHVYTTETSTTFSAFTTSVTTSFETTTTSDAVSVSVLTTKQVPSTSLTQSGISSPSGPAIATDPAPAVTALSPTQVPLVKPTGQFATLAMPSPPSSGAAAAAEPDWSFNSGISYSPYQANGLCGTVATIGMDLAPILADYDVVRIYGTDCNQVFNTLAALKGTKTRLIAGVFYLDELEAEVTTLIEQVAGQWQYIHTVSIGNEAVADGAPAATVVAAVNAARGMLRAAGFQGPVVVVDTQAAMVNNMALCDASDYCAINAHPFFDEYATPASAGQIVAGWVEQIAALANGKMVVVTETGWPTQGSPDGAAVPSPQNQQIALGAIRAALPSNVVLYSAYNEKWLQNSASTFGTENFWGIYGDAPSFTA